jgi:adenosylcobinamide kinase / adenosylcobinamide-phosphate guanylyltransferase
MPGHLITGGARSGKSAYAERLASEAALPTTYIATALACDDEMRARIEEHRSRRPKDWRTVECVDSDLAAAIIRAAKADTCTIVDCLTLWLGGILARADGDAGRSSQQLRLLETERATLVRALRSVPGTVFVVTNEIGAGVTPMGRLTRSFVDEHGTTNQRVAEACDRVTLMLCGIPLVLKAGGSHRAS